MGSEIQVKSTLGQGSIFWFELDMPVSPEWASAAMAGDRRKIIGYEGDRRKILAVDDSEVNCSVLTDLLIPLGFEVAIARDGLEGLERVAQFQPDLIVTDLIMPGMDGFEFTKRLRALPQGDDFIILAASASLLETEGFSSLEAGCNDFINKPIEVDLFLNYLEKYLELTWIYETVKEEKVATRLPDEAIVTPPYQELIALYQASRIGDIAVILAEANRIKNLDRRYQGFSDRVLDLADNFDDREILELLNEMFCEFAELQGGIV